MKYSEAYYASRALGAFRLGRALRKGKQRSLYMEGTSLMPNAVRARNHDHCQDLGRQWEVECIVKSHTASLGL